MMEIEAVPAFASVEELVALVAAVGETHVHVMVSNAPAEVALRLAEHGDGTTNFSTRSVAPDAALACARFARTHTAGYFEAQRAGVSLRVWPDQVWVSRLRTAPNIPTLTASKRTGEPTRYNVKHLDLEASLELWLAEAGGPVEVHVRGVLRRGLEYFLEAVAWGPYKVDSTLSTGDALALAQAYPRLLMSWAAGAVHMELPEYTARRFVLPKTGSEYADTHELFHSVRERPTLVSPGDETS